MNWTIKIQPRCKKELLKLDKSTQKFIHAYLKKVLEQKHPTNLGGPLTGNRKGQWRYRASKYRIICEIKECELVVLVIKVANRDVVYEDN